MARPPTVLLVSALASALLLGGCGGSGRGATHAGNARAVDQTLSDAPPEPLSLLPDESFVVLRADMVQLRESVYYDMLASLLQGFVRTVGGFPVDLVGVLARTDEVVAAALPASSAQGSPDIVVVLRGRYGDGELEATLRAFESEAAQSGSPTPLVVLPRGGRRVLMMEQLALVELGSHTWVLTSPQRIDELVARLEGGQVGPGPRGSATFRALAARVQLETAPVGAVVEVTPALRALLVGEAGRRDPIEVAIFESLVGAAARVTFERGVELEGLLQTTNPLVAAGAAELLEGFLVDLSQQGLVAGLLADRTIRVEGPTAHVSVRAPDPEVRASLSGLAAVISFLDALADDPPPGQQGPDEQLAPVLPGLGPVQ